MFTTKISYLHKCNMQSWLKIIEWFSFKSCDLVEVLFSEAKVKKWEQLWTFPCSQNVRDCDWCMVTPLRLVYIKLFSGRMVRWKSHRVTPSDWVYHDDEREGEQWWEELNNNIKLALARWCVTETDGRRLHRWTMLFWVRRCGTGGVCGHFNGWHVG